MDDYLQVIYHAPDLIERPRQENVYNGVASEHTRSTSLERVSRRLYGVSDGSRDHLRGYRYPNRPILRLNLQSILLIKKGAPESHGELIFWLKGRYEHRILE